MVVFRYVALIANDMFQHAFTLPSPRLYSPCIMHMRPIHRRQVIPLQGYNRRASMPALVRQLHRFPFLSQA